MEETIQYLFYEQPTLPTFQNWIATNTKENKLIDNEIENVFSKEDLAFWNENGYIVLKNAIPKEDCIVTQNAIWNFLNKSPEDETSWYVKHQNQNGLMVNFSNHPTLNKNRESARILKAYQQLYNSKKYTNPLIK